MAESTRSFALLRRRIEAMAGRANDATGTRLSLGHDSLDASLDGGLSRGRLHEVFASETDEAAAATGFAMMLALRAQTEGTPLLWLRTDAAERRAGRFHAPGFLELGGDPDRLMLAVAPDETMLLRCVADALRCAGLGMVVAECWGSPPALDLTASRRLTLAAEQSGVTALLLRIDASPAPSAADTRWSVAAAPSTPLEADAPGLPALDIELLRRRAGPAGQRWRVEWNRDERCFREPALPGAVVPFPVGGSAGDQPARLVRSA